MSAVRESHDDGAATAIQPGAPGLLAGYRAVVVRDLRLALRQRGDAVVATAFFVLTASIFPFALSPEPALLARIAPGVVWVTALLAVLLSLERMFLADAEDGSLELLLMSGLPNVVLVLAKVTAHWLTSGLPVMLAAPVIALMYGLPEAAYGPLVAAMAIGTPALSLIGAMGAGLTLGARRGGVLIALLMLPLYVPVLIFGAAAVDAAVAGLPVRPHLALLGAMSLGALALAPMVSAAALRNALD